MGSSWTQVVNAGADVGFVNIKNDTGAALAKGQVIMWRMAGTEDGLRVVDPAATTAGLVVGTAHTALAADATGLGQCYGPDDDAIVCRVGSASNDDLQVGDILDIYSASSCLKWAKDGQAVLESASDVVAVPPFFVAAGSAVSGGASSLSTTTCKVFLRCL